MADRDPGTMKCVKMVDLFPVELQFVDAEPIPAVPPEGALVKVLFTGMCRSDVMMWSKAPFLPLILGHEIAGSIDAIGESASNPDALAVGDQVVVYPWIGCEGCKPCRAGEEVYCDLPSLQQTELGITKDGGYAQYVAVPKLTFVVKVPDSVVMETAGMMACGMLTAYNAVQSALKYIDPVLAMRDKCGILIIGAGGLGLTAINLMKSLALSKYDNVELICADVLENKLVLAKEAGCHGVVQLKKTDSEEEKIQKVKSAFHEGGPHIVADFVGTNETFKIAYKSLKKTGTILCIGLFGGKIELPVYNAVVGAHNIHGIYTGSLQQMKQLIALVASGKVSTIPFEVFKLEEAPRLIHKLKAGEIEGRAILAPNLE